MTNQVQLEVTRGPMQGTCFSFEEHDTFVVGRESGCHVELPNDPAVSRHHCLLEVRPPRACLRDLGSLNGTFVNNEQITCQGADTNEDALTRNASVFLADGDTIRVGETEIRVTLLAFCSHCGGSIPAAAVPAEHTGELIELICQNCFAEDVTQPAPPSIRAEHAFDSTEAVRDMPTATHVAHDLTGLYETRCNAMANDETPRLEGFTFKSKLGRGACGEVYLAERDSDGFPVAIKTMVAQAHVSTTGRNRFLQEVQLLGELRHRNIVRIMDCSASENKFLFVMEYCDGGSLRQLVEKRGEGLAVSEAVTIMLQALDGMAFVHGHGVVHRDFKPGNLLLTHVGETLCAKVADLGLAKSFERAGFSGMTVTGTCGGSFPFMPREQLTNFKYVKPSADVWGAGATLYYMLTGEYPRTMGKDEDPMMVVLSRNAIPIRERKHDIPEDLAAIVDRSLNSEPASRFEDAETMRQALLSTAW